MVDTADLKSAGRETVRVQVPPPAPKVNKDAVTAIISDMIEKSRNTLTLYTTGIVWWK